MIDSKAPLKSEAAGGEKSDDLLEGAKDESKTDEKKEGSDEEDMEEERSWRRGYDCE